MRKCERQRMQRLHTPQEPPPLWQGRTYASENLQATCLRGYVLPITPPPPPPAPTVASNYPRDKRQQHPRPLDKFIFDLNQQRRRAGHLPLYRNDNQGGMY